MTGARGPKSKAGAARRNAPKAGTQLPAGSTTIPDPPPLKRDEAKAWWEALVGSPWLHLLSATDWQTACRGAALVDLFWLEPTAQLAAEIRQIESKLGMTAADRDRLGWKLDPPDPTKTDGDGAPAPTPSRKRPDPRRTAK